MTFPAGEPTHIVSRSGVPCGNRVNERTPLTVWPGQTTCFGCLRILDEFIDAYGGARGVDMLVGFDLLCGPPDGCCRY